MLIRGVGDPVESIAAQQPTAADYSCLFLLSIGSIFPRFFFFFSSVNQLRQSRSPWIQRATKQRTEELLETWLRATDYPSTHISALY